MNDLPIPREDSNVVNRKIEQRQNQPKNVSEVPPQESTKSENYIKLPLRQIIDFWKNSQKMFFEVHDKIKYKCESL